MNFRNLIPFARNRRGNIALTTALAIVPLTMMLGMGIDIGNATRVKLSLQDATDEAAISLARQQASIADTAISSTANTYVMNSFKGTTSVTVTTATIDRNSITATLDTRANVPTFFSQVVGVSTIPVTAHAVAKGTIRLSGSDDVAVTSVTS